MIDRHTLLIACAQAANEVNRAYCAAIGDLSQPAWKDAPQWQIDSAIAGVEGALAGNTPAQSHQQWCDLKIAQGWTHGPIKDPDKKQHPCLVPYDHLPAEQTLKDDLYLSTVRAMARALELL